MAGDEVVYGVTNWPRNDPRDDSQPPETAHVTRDPEAGVGTDRDLLFAAARMLDPDHRLHVRDAGMTRANLPARVAVERGEAKRMLPLVPEDELHRGGAEAAGAVVQQ